MTNGAMIYRGIRVMNPQTGLDVETDVLLQAGHVVAMGADVVHHAASANAETAAGDGLWLTPAFVDLCARLREPGPKQHGTIASETRAARAGGFAHIVMPPDTTPVIDHAAIATQVIEKSQAAGQARVYPMGAMTKGLEGQALAAMGGLKTAGCLGISQARKPMAHTETWLRCFEYAASMGLPVYLMPEDASLAQGSAHDGFMAARLGLVGIPDTAETIALATQLLLVEQTGVRAHVGQLSCAASVELIARAKDKGLPVTADVAMHHLHLTDAAIDGFNAMAHVRPPLRRESDRLALLAGLRDGTIDAICSDHQPLNAAAKLAPFAEALPGMSTLETMLPLALRLAASNEASLHTVLQAMTFAPARIAGIAAGDIFTPGAGLAIIDPRQAWQIGDAQWRSKGKNSAFVGQPLVGRVLRVH